MSEMYIWLGFIDHQCQAPELLATNGKQEDPILGMSCNVLHVREFYGKRTNEQTRFQLILGFTLLLRSSIQITTAMTIIPATPFVQSRPKSICLSLRHRIGCRAATVSLASMQKLNTHNTYNFSIIFCNIMYFEVLVFT